MNKNMREFQFSYSRLCLLSPLRCDDVSADKKAVFLPLECPSSWLKSDVFVFREGGGQCRKGLVGLCHMRPGRRCWLVQI